MTVIHNETGFRCHTLGEFCEAVRRAPGLDSNAIRRSAMERYSYNAIAPQYENYFERLLTVNDDGWYSEAADTLLGGRI